jgi:formylmethanofuran dehydrogenase subunit E
MIALSRHLDDHLAASAALHTRLCPQQVIGVRMARLACAMLHIDPAIQRKQIFVFMECRRCAADGVIAVTGASPTNRLMAFTDYGKVAATFVNLRTGDALRVSEHPESRATAVEMITELPRWEAQLQAYQIMPDDQLLRWQSVRLHQPLPYIPEKYAVHCEKCGERVNEHCEVVVRGQVLCKACARGAYYCTMPQEKPTLSKSKLP